jgi:hypothetical protein
VVEPDVEREAAEVLVRLRAQKKQTIGTGMLDDYARRAMVWGRTGQVSRLSKGSVESVDVAVSPFLGRLRQEDRE